MKHVLGLYIAFGAFIAMTDVAVMTATNPAMRGLGWQAELLAPLPLLCVVVSLLVFLGAPVGNRSRFTLVRSIGRIPALGRYFVFVGVVCGTVLLGVLSLNAVVSDSIQSLTIPDDTPMSITTRIDEDVGEGVVFELGSRTRVYFPKEKRAAVLRALEREGIAVEE